MKHEYEVGLYGLRHMPAHLEGICRSAYGVCQQLQQVFSTSSGDVTAGGADPTALSRIEEYHSIKLR